VNENGNWRDVAPPALANAGMITDASWSDIDADGDPDLAVVGDWMAIHLFKNDNGILAPFTIPESNGWWNRIVAADIDGDGDNDFVVGNWGLNTKFKASVSRPLTMYVNDFDQNGKSEFIINWYPHLDSISYPFATKPELTAQLPLLKKQILHYEDYGSKTYETLFPAELRSRSLQYLAGNLQTGVLWNSGGSFEFMPLPIEAQFSPVFGIVADDLDGDGQVDIWLGGNFYSLKPQAGRHNASRGIFFKGMGNHSFTYMNADRSGVYVEGEVRDAASFTSNNLKNLLVLRNNAKALLFRRSK
jgi:hypothetical protein